MAIASGLADAVLAGSVFMVIFITAHALARPCLEMTVFE